ncbi:MAG: cytochrome ubiquinol oxidase subunit I [Spirochaetes bacterium]|nr:cytochrome ubiquinol oxidase subunit I [Spirochaetota bacterium]
MDAVLLSRIQFGINAGFHFIFPPITLGLTLLLVIVETRYYRTRDEVYKIISSFLVKILALVFALGVATGIVLEFAFGTNWANYSRMVGDIFGAPLAAEGIFAFFLESVFIGVLIWGRHRVSPRAYMISAVLVFLASHLSGLWIIIANSWMHTPAGYEVVHGRAVLVDVMAAVLNPSILQRFSHTVVGAWITGSLFTAGICAWLILKGRSTVPAKKMLVTALIIFSASAVLQFGTGHAHAVQVTSTSPERMASYEALWKTQKGAPMSLFGLPDEEARVTHFELAVPKLLSLLVHFDPEGTVQGLDGFPRDSVPPLLPVYITYHLMIALGSLFAAMAGLSVLFLLLKRIDRYRWYLWLLVLASPLPLLANEVGWISAEIGRQPWAVYGVLKTAEAVSINVPASHVLASLIMFAFIYITLFLFFVLYLFRIVGKGMEGISSGY